MGGRLHRIRHRCGSLGLPESSGTNCQAIHGQMSSSGERIGRLCPEPGRMRRRRLRVSFTDPRRPRGDLGTANRQDSTKAALGRPPPVDDKNFSRAAPRRRQNRLHTTNLGRAALRPDERQVRAALRIRGPAEKLRVLVEHLVGCGERDGRGPTQDVKQASLVQVRKRFIFGHALRLHHAQYIAR